MLNLLQGQERINNNGYGSIMWVKQQKWLKGSKGSTKDYNEGLAI